MFEIWGPHCSFESNVIAIKIADLFKTKNRWVGKNKICHEGLLRADKKK